ncbi:F0F1 ATP synthase subunit delta [Buchnera aphidicola]|uniref:F0F1 ATP synthase subunit delta n=1 Tax=Buchnera aphidicola TaxID=9 RepID=UPI0031B6F8CB
MINADTISRPYAKAIFKLSIEENCINYWEKKLFFFSKISESKEIKKILLSNYSYKYINKVFITAYGKKLKKNEEKLIYLLAFNKRLIYLKNIFSFFLKYKNKYEKKLYVSIISSKKLSNSDISQISNILRIKFSKNIIINTVINMSIIGGLIIKINDIIIDGSICTHLKQLKSILRA